MSFSSISSLLCLLSLFLLRHTPSCTCSESLVRYLPGFDGPLPFQLSTGYVSIDEDSEGVELFYYFIKSENIPSKDPIIFWFTGGPGCSVLNAITYEIGPLLFNVAEYNGSLPTLKLNPYSWTKVSNIVFSDQPTGTGFSYSKAPQGNLSDTKSTKQSYIFIKKWLTDHPEFLSNPLYICGDSYAGITVPVIVQMISDGITAGDELLINLKGYMLGNPMTNHHFEENSAIQFAYGMGILSRELYESVKKNCDGEYINVDPGNVQCNDDLQLVSECTSGLFLEYILGPKCSELALKSKEIIKYRHSQAQQSGDIINSPHGFCGFDSMAYNFLLSDYWANDEKVRIALKIRKGKTHEWIRCNAWGDRHYVKNVKNTIGYHVNLSRKGYRTLIYSGDHDMVVPFQSTQSWIKSLNYSITDDWRPWFVKGEVGGYTRTYANKMTFTTIKGGGHTAPTYKPYECLVMVKRWLSYAPL